MQLDAEGLALARGARQLFSGLSFTLAQGNALHIGGANGSGKSSLMRVLCGLARPDQGAVRWCGADIGQAGEAFRSRVVYLGHAEALKHDLLAWENLAFGPLLGMPDARMRAMQALELAGLAREAALPTRALSQGQRKRVALARLHLAAPASLWILDEPFSALDSAASAHLTQLLERHCQDGGMLIYTTHQDGVLPRAATLMLGKQDGPQC